MNLRCPGCSNVLRIPDTAAGVQFKCPKCGQIFATPASAPAAPAPPPAPAPAPEREDPPPAVQPHAASEDIPHVLGGYEIVKELGRGGMGRVYLARQKSLDRLVALKVMDPARVRRPVSVARFRREAFAAAQIAHHNVVQIYDIGNEKDLHFFTMEYVRGESLMSLVEREGSLDPVVAAGYILQAARGLKSGHDIGMVHRDVKPDNLLLNEQGIIKVADMGLVKLAAVDTHMTRIGGMMGTPNYMAPEQARNAVDVDGRADIYSLGCTLYVLLTAQLPFEGKTVTQVKTRRTAVDRPNSPAPPSLSAILNKMVARDREERYANMEAVIAALEKYLGSEEAGARSRDEQIAVVQECVHQFNNVPRVRVRQMVVWGLAGCVVLAALFWLAGESRTAAAMVGLALLTPLAFHVLHGWREGTHLFTKLRATLTEISWLERLAGIGAVLVVILVLYLLNLLALWSAMLLLGIVLAAIFYLFVDRPLALERKPALDKMQALLRTLRRQGCDERSARRFVCKHAGRDWEEFFEELFGYDAKLKARRWLIKDNERRRRFAAWRDPLLHWLDAREKAGKDARERQLLESAEIEALQEEGATQGEARKKATRLVTALVAQAAQVEQESPASTAPTTPATYKMLNETERPYDNLEEVEEELPTPWLERLAGIAGWLVGGEARLITGALLFTGFVLWFYQNGYADGQKLIRDVQNAVTSPQINRVDRLGVPLRLSFLPSAMGNLFRSFNPGIAAVLLVVSTSWFGWRSCLLAWLAAATIVIAPLMTWNVRPLTPGTAGILAGLAIAWLAYGCRD